MPGKQGFVIQPGTVCETEKLALRRSQLRPRGPFDLALYSPADKFDSRFALALAWAFRKLADAVRKMKDRFAPKAAEVLALSRIDAMCHNRPPALQKKKRGKALRV